MARLPILMYHNVSQKELESNGLTISIQKLENQFRYLVENNFVSFHLSELETLLTIPPKSVVLTFDDVTENQLFYAFPLLEKYKDRKSTRLNSSHLRASRMPSSA